ncbi:MAG: class I SAM-dependent methyltransferase [Chloroflexota bacterium]|nr:class I SAM-dependent methyltransferase [Chloroflexota bacterium]
MVQSLAIKKQVSLHWGSLKLDLDVAQDLFSSHQVDRGSKMLLSSLECVDLPENGEAVDFGCGYGVLGIAWQAVHPGWSMRYVDRDALAVWFAEHNVGQAIPHLADRVRYLHDVTPPQPSDVGFDLVLWNVPGKAGAKVLASLTAIALDGLGTNGLLALVVVNPLVETIREAGAGRPGVVCERDEAGRDHTVLHFRKATSDVSWRHAFDEGEFDRPETRFTLGDREWALTPVIGLPEYDSLSHSTTLAGVTMERIGSDAVIGRWLVHEPGAGHLAVLAALVWPDAQGLVTSRDALALRSTEQALRRECPQTTVEFHPVGRLVGPMNGQLAVDAAIIAVADQIQLEGLGELVDAVASCMQPGGTAILHGGSTEIGRLERMASKDRRWRTGKRTKHSGASAIPIFRGDLP